MTVAARTMDLEKTARLCHALSDETRLRLLELLMDGEQCVCDLTDTLKTGQSRLSFHLKTLKDAGLLTDRKDGRWVYYALDPDAIEGLEDLANRLRTTVGRMSPLPKRCD